MWFSSFQAATGVSSFLQKSMCIGYKPEAECAVPSQSYQVIWADKYIEYISQKQNHNAY